MALLQKVDVATLFERHGRAVRRYLRTATGSPQLAEDLAQDVFLRVARDIGRYEPRDRDRAWLFRIARNTLTDHRRRTAVRPAVTDANVEPVTEPVQSLQLDLRQALARLPDIEREMFVLAEIGGLSYAEIAAVLDVTVPSVRSALYRARLTLRSTLLPPSPLRPELRRGSSDDD